MAPRRRRCWRKPGARVVVGYNKGEARAKEVVAALAGSGHRAQHIVLEDSATMRKAADDVRAAYGRCDILVNSAGFTKPVPHANLEALDDALFDSVLIANVRGPFAMIRAFAPLLKRKRRRRRHQCVVDRGLHRLRARASPMPPSKAALDNMTMSLGARAWPGNSRAVRFARRGQHGFRRRPQHRRRLKKLAAESPLRRVVEPDDVAHTIMGCVLHLKTSTGVKIVCDGGRFLV